MAFNVSMCYKKTAVTNVILGYQVIQASLNDWLLGNSENTLLLSAFLHEELFAGVFEHSTHDTSETEKEKEKEGAGTRSDSLRAPQRHKSLVL